MLKKIILLAILIVTTFWNANASHAAGGEIWYEYIGTTQNPHRYQVFLEFYRDVSGIPAPSTYNICVSSSCFGNSSVTATLYPIIPKFGSDTIPGSVPGSIITPGQSYCVDVNSPGQVITETYLAMAVVDLPGVCADFVFAYSVSARNPSTNLTTSGNYYIEATLNNLNGPNTSPKFINPATKSFCVGRPTIWSQAATEPDGDSIYYAFGTPMTGGCYNSTPMVFSTGYSATNPMSTVSGISLNPGTGLLLFTPSQPEVDVIHLTTTEYRFDSTLQTYSIVGSSEMDIQVSIVTGCRIEMGKWLTDPTDTLNNVAPIKCGDSIVNISTKRNFLTSSSGN